MKFHYLARAVIVKDNQILLAREVGKNNTFLPGGHIEVGEGAKEALKREIKEELGLNSMIGNFLGALECSWPERSGDNAEINLIFKTFLVSEDEEVNIQSQESHLEFLWAPISDIDSFNLLPEPLNILVKKDETDDSAFWGSSI